MIRLAEPPKPTIDGDRLRIVFEEWGSESYQMFLRSKTLPEHHIEYDWEHDRYILTAPARFASIFGIDPPRRGTRLPLSAHLFDYQIHFVQAALRAKRFACWADTGLGKTHIGIEFARQVAAETGKRVLIVSPLNIVNQWCEVADEYFPDTPLYQIKGSEALKPWCSGPVDGMVGIINPEKMLPNGERISELSHLGAVVLDEASILKSGGGRTKWMLIHSCKGIEYKLSLTATPAPNDIMEYASQGSFLERLRSDGEIIWTYYRRDKEGNWHVKEHAREAFYRFMAGWSVYLRHPARYGFEDNLRDLPDPETYVYRIAPSSEQMEIAQGIPDTGGQMQLFEQDGLGIVARGKLNQIAHGFLYEKGEDERTVYRFSSPLMDAVEHIVREDADAGHQVLVWTLYDAESDDIKDRLRDVPGVAKITGKMPVHHRLPLIESFRKGELPILISRASMLGLGQNFQRCTSMVFSGFDDSFERFYQAVRRAYRYGQRKSVRVHVPYIPELQGPIYENVQTKQAQFDRDAEIMERYYAEAMREVVA